MYPILWLGGGLTLVWDRTLKVICIRIYCCCPVSLEVSLREFAACRRTQSEGYLYFHHSSFYLAFVFTRCSVVALLFWLDVTRYNDLDHYYPASGSITLQHARSMSPSAAPTLHHPSTMKTALLLIDIQSGIDPFEPTHYFGHTRSTTDFESNVTTLLARTRDHNRHEHEEKAKVMIIHVNHDSVHPTSPLYPGKAMNAPMAYAKPVDGEVMIRKSVNSAFVGTGLEGMLRSENIRQLLVCGLVTGHCVSTSVRMARDLDVIGNIDSKGGKGVIAVIEDCCAAFEAGGFDAETVHKVNIETLRGEFADVVVVKEWLHVLGGRGR
jgi:nicotinamidase-related amidase